MSGVFFIVCIPKEVYEMTLKINKKEILIADNDSVEFSECTINILQESKRNQADLNTSRECFLPSSNSGRTKNISMLKSKSADILHLEEGNISSKRKSKSWDDIDVLNTTNLLNEHDSSSEYDKDLSMEKLLKKVLQKLKIENAVWCDAHNDKYYQVIFPLEAGLQCENALEKLYEYGIGHRQNSILSVIPCSIYYNLHDDSNKIEMPGEEIRSDTKKEQAKNSAWDRFVSSVRARLTVAQVVENIRTDAALTFDFMFLLVIATVLSAISLAENNNVYLVSSMLISPMMGPVMAGTFGTVIQDKKLQKTGVQNELIGLGTATFVGFCYGLMICSVTDKYGTGDWPTHEMVSRGEIRTLWVGCLIALLSGAAVALGILGDNVASLVGVAISASLMPPAVNAGLLWAMAAVYAVSEESSLKSIVKTRFYSDNEVCELAALGAVSMCLTFVNIVCIYLAGIIVFRIKEVAPMSSRDQSRRFWKYDIKIARDYNKTLQHEDGRNLINNLPAEAAKFTHNKCNFSLLNISTLSDPLSNPLYHSIDLQRERCVDVGKIQYTWSPSMFGTKRINKELKNLCLSVFDEEARTSRNSNKNFTGNNILSKLFSQNTPSTPRASGSSSSGSKHFISSRTRKFTVTPASIDVPGK